MLFCLKIFFTQLISLLSECSLTQILRTQTVADIFSRSHTNDFKANSQWRACLHLRPYEYNVYQLRFYWHLGLPPEGSAYRNLGLF